MVPVKIICDGIFDGGKFFHKIVTEFATGQLVFVTDVVTEHPVKIGRTTLWESSARRIFEGPILTDSVKIVDHKAIVTGIVAESPSE